MGADDDVAVVTDDAGVVDVVVELDPNCAVDD